MQRPALRKDLLVTREEGGPVLVQDPRTRRSRQLSPDEFEFARQLSATRDVDEALSVARARGVSLSIVAARRVVSELSQLGLLTVEDGEPAPRPPVRPTGPPPLVPAPAVSLVTEIRQAEPAASVDRVELHDEEDQTSLDPRAPFGRPLTGPGASPAVRAGAGAPAARSGMFDREVPASAPPVDRVPEAPPPRLRSDLIVRERERGRLKLFEVIDPLSRRLIVLYEAEMKIARQLDGQKDLFGLMELARGLGLGVSPSKLMGFIAMLQNSGFLETEDANLGRNEFSVMAPLPVEDSLVPALLKPGEEQLRLAVSQFSRGDTAGAERTLLGLLQQEPGLKEAWTLLEMIRREGGPRAAGLAVVPATEPSSSIEVAEELREPSSPLEVHASLFGASEPDQLSAQLASLQRSEEPPRRSVLGTLLKVTIVLGVLGGAAFFAYPFVAAALFKTEVTITQISLVSPIQSSVELASPGYVVPRVSSKISARVAGRVSKVLVQEGSRVKTGDALIELDASELEGAIAVARARVKSMGARAAAARGSVAEAQQQVNRMRPIVKMQLGAPAQLEDLEARARSVRGEARAAAAEVQAQRAEVESLELSREQLTLRAPIDGVVVTNPIQVGEMLTPGGADALEIADMSTLLVETDVPEARLSMVRPGSPCEIVLDAFPSRRFRGSTVEISRQINREKATVAARVAFVDPHEGVLPQMAARVSFLTEAMSQSAISAPPKLVVASTAVVARGAQRVLFVAEGEIARMHPVVLGQQLGENWELVAPPLPQGTRVIDNPPADLADGAAIRERSR